MKINIENLFDTFKGLTLYSGLALVFYYLTILLDLSDSIFTNVSYSLLMAWLISNIFLYKRKPLKHILNFDWFTCTRNIFLVLSPILFFLAVLAVMYLCGSDISKNPNFSFDGYYLSMSLLIFKLALFEELIFRGFLLQYLSEKYNTPLLVFISSLIFSISHILNPEISFLASLNIFLAGSFLAILYLKTQNIIFTTVFHFLWNLGQQFFLDSAISGNDIGLNYYNIDNTVNNNIFDTCIISKFGIESSIVTTLFLILLVYIVAKYNKSPYLNSLFYKKTYRL